MKITGAVITADIVNSSGLDKKALNALTKKLKATIHANRAKSLFYRGDSFQCFINNPNPAFKLGLQLRTVTRVFLSEAPGIQTDLKISLGIGSIDTPVVKINEATGEAFVISGRELDDPENEGRLYLIKSENSAINIALDAISLFTDYLFSNLTLKQADVLNLLLKNKTQMEIARSLKKSQSTINSHARALGWKELEHLISNYNKCILKILYPDEQ